MQCASTQRENVFEPSADVETGLVEKTKVAAPQVAPSSSSAASSSAAAAASATASATATAASSAQSRTKRVLGLSWKVPVASGYSCYLRG